MEKFKGTKGEWMLPHFANPKTTCDCGFILNEGYCGAIANVYYSKDNKIENGDNPLLEEAIANANLIASAPMLLEALQYIVNCSTVDRFKCELPDAIIQAQSAINKALGL